MSTSLPTKTAAQADEIEAAKAQVAVLESAAKKANEELNAGKAKLAELQKPFKPAPSSTVQAEVFEHVGFGAAAAPAPAFGAAPAPAPPGKTSMLTGWKLFQERRNHKIISKYSLCALAASAEITNVCGEFFEEMRGVLKVNLEKLMKDVITITEHCR